MKKSLQVQKMFDNQSSQNIKVRNDEGEAVK